MPGDQLFIGVDGGGTKTTARVRDGDGRLLGEAVAGPGNARLGAVAQAEIMEACLRALEYAGLSRADFGTVHAGFGLAGVQQEADLKEVREWEHPFASLTIDTDAFPALLGAFRGDDGAILIVGTGTAGLAIIGGKRTTVGGWGPEIADEGSGMAIGRTAIRRSIWAVEGIIPMTPLAGEVIAAFSGRPEEATLWAGNAQPADFARFTPAVFAHAERRDPLAIAILHEAALDVERQVTRLLDLGAPAVAMIGGVFPKIHPWLAPPIRDRLIVPEGDAVDGAILMAERAAAAS